MPEVVQVSAGLWRMYYGQIRSDTGWDILYAESTDAKSFTPKGTALAGTTNKLDPEFIIRGASLVSLPGGRWRMYYGGSPWFPENSNLATATPPPYWQTFSAISSDGINFVREGVRFSHPQFDANATMIGAGHGRVIQLDDGRYIAYMSSTSRTQNISGVYQFVSSDGLTFTSPVMVSAGHDPYIVRNTNKTYLMYVDTSYNGPFQASALLASNDGLKWSSASTATFTASNGVTVNIGPDVGGILLPDGTVRLYTNYNRGFAWYSR